ncbi:MAG TPA: TonB-dependent receptor [Bryobacteraceae bacterium]|nr:TonB-dependent receptor [Bryobacteraceae bacterium]
MPRVGLSRLPLLPLLILAGAGAQTPDTVTIQGHVIDASRAPVNAVDVTVTNALTGAKRTARTDESGDFAVTGLPAGATFGVKASKEGFAPFTLNSLIPGAGATAELTLKLDVASGSSQITVTGVAGEIRTDAPQLGDRIIGQQLQETPILDRRITFYPLLDSANKPAINQGDIFTNQFLFTTNGSGRRQTSFDVDGTTGNDSWGRQTIFTNIPLAATQEISVLTNAFSAEYGGSTGAAVNIVTRTGGNRLRGQFVEVWRPAATSAALSGFTASSAASGNDYTSNSMGQTALSVGGPLGSDRRTHFFVAAEYTRENKASPVTSPVAPGSFLGRYRGWLGFFRLDRQINDRHNIFLRGNLDAFYDTNPNGIVGGNTLPSVARVFHRRTYSIVLGETAVLSPNLLNNLRAQFMLASPITQFSPEVYGTQYQVPISTGGTFTSGTSQAALLLNRQYEINDTISLARGRHILRAGAGVLAAHTGGDSKEFGGPIYLGQFLYNTCALSLDYCESPAYLNNIANVRTYTQSYGNAAYTVNDALWSLFVQDDFRARPNLTLNFGLRYEQQTFTDFRKGFAPRAGLSWNPHGDGKTVIRGGFGIYYSQITDNSEANYALTGPTGVFNYSASPGQIGFPTSVSAVPLPAFPPGAQMPLRSLYIRPGDRAYLDQFFPTSTLIGYPSGLLNPYSEQWTFGVERRIAKGWVARADYVGSHTLRINRPLDVDPPAPVTRTAPGQVRSAQAANCTRPYWIWWYAQHNTTCNPNTATNPQPPYAVIQSDVNNGYAIYHSLQTNLTGRISGLTVMTSYTWSHAIDNVDPDIPSQNPNDANFTGRAERASAIFDQRQRAVLSGVWSGFWGLHIGGIATLATGLPYNYVTGVNNSGDTGATTDRPVIGDAVVGRNAGRGSPIYELSTLVERPITFNEHLRIEPRIEVLNIFNHPNFVGYSGTYGNGAAPGPGFGAPLAGVTNQLEARSLQFQIKALF